MHTGRIAGLWIYPVKGCRGIPVEAAPVEPMGLAHDRRWMVVRPSGRFLTQRELPALARVGTAIEDGRLVLDLDGQRHPVQPAAGDDRLDVTVWRQRLPAIPQSPEIDRLLSEFVGRAVRLVRFAPEALRPCDPAISPPGARTGFADGFPLLLASTSSLARLNDHLGEAGSEPVPMARFRPNLIVDGLPPWAEDEAPWLRAGTTVFRLVSPCERCIVTTTDQASGERLGEEPLRTLRRVHSDTAGFPLFGWNLVPVLDEEPAPRLQIGDRVALASGPQR
jgi:uncharacterized protein YcbX